MQTDNPIKAGIIAFGVAGQIFHAPFLQHTDGFILHKISTSNKVAKAQFGHLYPQTNFVHSADDIINDPEIELVVIGTPNQLHYPLAKQALEAGKHVLVEKPFTIYSKDATELIKIANEKNLVLCVNHNRRYDTTLATLKEVITSGNLGRIVHYENHFDRFRPQLRGVWREEAKPGTGILYDLGSHLIDQSVNLFGRPNAVTAITRNQRDGSVTTDYFHLLLHHKGVESILHSGMLVKKLGPACMVYGTNGTFIKYGLDVQEAALKNGETPNSADWGADPEDLYPTITYMEGEKEIEEKVKSVPGDYRLLFKNLHDAIRKGTPLNTKPEEARDVIKIIEWAEQSAAEKRTIEINWQE